MKPRRKNLLLLGAISLTLAAPSAFAATLYWDTDSATSGSGPDTTPGGTWATGGTTWSTDSTGATTTAARTTGAGDDLFFSAGTDATGSYTATLGANQTARTLTFQEGAVTITANTLTLAGGGGITVNSAAGNAIISSSLTLSGNNVFDVGSGRTLTLDTGDTFNRIDNRATLSIRGAGSVSSTMTNLSSNVNNIIGPWASAGSTTGTTYAKFSGSTISGLTYTGGADGTAAAAASDVISTGSPGTVNYNLNAAGTLGLNASINTLRYGGAAGTLATNTSFTTKGIMNAGTGLLTFSGAVRSAASGNTTEMVVNTANNNIDFNGVFTGTITKTGSGTMTLGAAAHSIGGIVVNEGILITNHSAGNGITASSVTVNSGGTLRFGSGGDFADTGTTFTVNAGGTFDLNGNSDTIGAIAGAGSIASTGAANLSVTSGTQAFSGAIGGAVSLIVNGATAALTLSGTNTFTGTTTITAGSLQLGNGGTTGNLGGTTGITNNSNLTINRSNAFEQSVALNGQAIGGSGSFTQAGAGTTTLNVNNTFTGTTIISAGSLQLGSGGTTGTIGGTTGITNNANLTINRSNDFDQSVALNGQAIGGGGSFTQAGAGATTLSVNNTFTGATTISAGSLLLGHVTALGGNTPGVNGTSAISMATGTTLRSTVSGVTVSAPITTTGSVTIGAPSNDAGQVFSELILNGAIGGAGTTNVNFDSFFNKNTIQTVTLGTANTYSGNTTIGSVSAGTSSQVFVKLGVDNALPTTTILSIQGGTGSGSGRGVGLNLFGYNQTLAGLTNTAASLRVQQVVNSDVSAAATLTINGSTNTTYTGFLGSNGANFSVNVNAIPESTNGNNFGLTKDGTGTFTLNPTNVGTYANNTFSGPTKILGGILNLAAANAMSQSPLDTLNSVTGHASRGLRTTVATLTLGGLTGDKDFADVFTTTTGGYSGLTALTLNPVSGATHSYSGDIGNGSGSMSLTKTGAGTQILSGTNTYSGGTTVSAGTLVLSDANAVGTGVIALSGASTVLQIASGITLANATNDITISSTTASVNRLVAASGAYNTGTLGSLTSSFTGGQANTTAEILGGTSSLATTLEMLFSDTAPTATNDGIRRSDVFTTAGTSADTCVIQLSTGALAADSVLGWLNGTNWVHAGTGTFYTTAFLDLATHPLGSYGYNSGNVWAVVNQGGSFAAIPEPTSALAGLLLTAGLLRRRRK